MLTSFFCYLTVLCQTTLKLTGEQKFCVTAIVVSKFTTTCHQPPGMKTVSPGQWRISSLKQEETVWLIHFPFYTMNNVVACFRICPSPQLALLSYSLSFLKLPAHAKPAAVTSQACCLNIQNTPWGTKNLFYPIRVLRAVCQVWVRLWLTFASLKRSFNPASLSTGFPQANWLKLEIN